MDDICSIREYYLLHSPKFANKLIDQIFSNESLIASFPYVGRVVPELNNTSVRELIYKNLRIIYVVVEVEMVHVIAVHPSSQPLSELSLFG
uniref:type II toxin-antitoxin system RelE/ParE family toxin n=1 Tax=Algoriphagus locisalis TaxID=305507 RepID=UPI00244E7302|nr:type II toxin-antitoxin system RelE/ParE family toxin [Algoriphagus locisalis]